MADVPVAKPSKPSVILAPFEIATTTNITIGIKINHPMLSPSKSL